MLMNDSFLYQNELDRKRLVRLCVNIKTHQKEPGTRVRQATTKGTRGGLSENRWLRSLTKRVIFRRCSSEFVG